MPNDLFQSWPDQHRAANTGSRPPHEEFWGAVGRMAAEGTDKAVDLSGFLREIAESTAAFLAVSSRLELSFSSSGVCRTSVESATRLGLIVVELVGNSIKYAHPTGVRGRISVGCRRRLQGDLLVEVSDDGVGLPEGFDPYTSQTEGFQLVRDLAQQLDAKLIFLQSGVGLVIRLTAPASLASYEPGVRQ